MSIKESVFSYEHIKEISLGNAKISKIFFKSSIVILVQNSSLISAINVHNRKIITLTRNNTSNLSEIFCSDINTDRSHFVTGLINGEILLWSFNSKTVDQVGKISDPIVHISFLSNSLSALCDDVFGNVYQIQFNQGMFRNKITITQMYRFEQELTAFSVKGDFLYTSNQFGTSVFSIGSTLTCVWSDSIVSRGFSFFTANKDTFIARIADHEVLLSDSKGLIIKSYKFSQTPSSISIVGHDSILAMFNGLCMLTIGDKLFSFDTPNGIADIYGDSIFIYNNGLHRVWIVPLSERIRKLCQDKNYEAALMQISSFKDVEDLNSIIQSYYDSLSFKIDFFIGIVEKFGFFTYLFNLPPSPKKYSIYDSILSKTDIFWPFTFGFIKEIFEIFPKDQRIPPFFNNVNIRFDWIEFLIGKFLEQGFFKMAEKVSYEYCGDIYMTLSILHYIEDFSRIYEIMNNVLLVGSNLREQESIIQFIINTNPYDLVLYDMSNFDKIFTFVISGLRISEEIMSRLVEQFSIFLPPHSLIWQFIAPIMNRKKINSSAVRNVIDFLINGPNELFEFKLSLFKVLSEIPSSNLKELLQIARYLKSYEQEMSICKATHDVDEFINCIIANGVQSYYNEILSITRSQNELKDALLRYGYHLLAINPEEYCKLMVSFSDITLFQKSFNLFSKKSEYLWHLLVNSFQYPLIINECSEKEAFQYISFMCLYRPHRVYQSLIELGNLPLDKVLILCKERGIVDSYLYICRITHDLEKAISFGTKALQAALMDGDASSIVQQIVLFLDFSREEQEIKKFWMVFFESFQLPLYAHTRNPQKLEIIIGHFSKFMESMIQVVDAGEISQSFVHSFSFLTFRIANPIILHFFKSIREKTQFTNTYSEILNHEIVESEIDYFKRKNLAVVYKGECCAKCSRQFSSSDFIASNCGHVFHVDCAQDFWCPICQIKISKIDTSSCLKGIDYFEQLDYMEKSLTKSKIVEKTTNKSSLCGSNQLTKPKIGKEIIVTL